MAAHRALPPMPRDGTRCLWLPSLAAALKAQRHTAGAVDTAGSAQQSDGIIAVTSMRAPVEKGVVRSVATAAAKGSTAASHSYVLAVVRVARGVMVMRNTKAATFTSAAAPVQVIAFLPTPPAVTITFMPMVLREEVMELATAALHCSVAPTLLPRRRHRRVVMMMAAITLGAVPPCRYCPMCRNRTVIVGH